jgi:hypothetical protein
MTPEEVRLVMNGWLENQSQVALVGQLWGFALAVRCRIEVVTDESVGLTTSDGGRIVVDISEPGTAFKYAERRELPKLAERFGLTGEQLFAPSITMLFPSRSEEDEPSESLHFAELIP